MAGFPTYKELVTLSLTLDRVILHTVVHRSLTSTKCHWNQGNFLWTDGQTSETGFIRSTQCLKSFKYWRRWH